MNRYVKPTVIRAGSLHELTQASLISKVDAGADAISLTVAGATGPTIGAPPPVATNHLHVKILTGGSVLGLS